ncbi:MAG TPA: hypothetical protein VL120_11750 [Solirubrobacteraceae bacterium]|jgi:hypothetical protein|nr:hypothetical protein [Solirubrobacteraceae bacterium]
MIRYGTTTKRVAAVATALGLTALAAPVLSSPASAAGARIGARAIVDSPRGPVLLARVTGQTTSLKVTFACKGGAAVSTRTLRGAASDTAAARITGANSQRVTRCAARAGASQRSVPALPAGGRAAGARLVGILGPALPQGSTTRLDVAISAPGTITVKTTAGRTLLTTGRHLAGVYRLFVRNAPRGTGLVVTAIGASDRILAGPSPSAATPPPGQETVTPDNGQGTPPAGPGTPAPPQNPTPQPQRPVPPAVPVSHLSLSCPGNVGPGAPLVVSGQITPATEGVTIVVSFSVTGRPSTSQTVQTGPGGTYTAQTSDPLAFGTWSIQSFFAGTPTLQASSSPTCLTRTP